MDKEILVNYSDALARVKLLRSQMEKKEKQLDKLRERGMVADTVSYGKRGKKSLGITTIVGCADAELQRASRAYEKGYAVLLEEEQKLLELITQVEEYIAGIGDIKIRNIMTLYYVEDMNWVQVAHKMNDIYDGKKSYFTDGSCRLRHDRFLEKNK